MARQQLDLFSTSASPSESSSLTAVSQPDKLLPTSLEDAELDTPTMNFRYDDIFYAIDDVDWPLGS